MDGPLLIATASLAGVIILAVVGLATLIVNQGRGLRRDLDRLEDNLRGDLAGLRGGQGELRERMAKLEGLREAVTGRCAA